MSTDPRKHWKRVCKAHRTDGEPCRAPAMRGQLVCKVHGGSSPQARAAAQQRILAAADPAAAKLVELLDDDSATVQLRAAQALLDRAGLVAQAVAVETDSDEQVIRISFADRNW